MLRRVAIVLLVIGYVGVGCVAAGLAAHWYFRITDAQAAGFQGYWERYAAAHLGFADPDAYRAHVAETDRKAREAKAIDDRRRREEERRKRERELPELACFVAQNRIKDRLREPSAARFPSCSGLWHVTTQGHHKWLVTSYVELPDFQGIYRRQVYIVSVEYQESTDQLFTQIIAF